MQLIPMQLSMSIHLALVIVLSMQRASILTDHLLAHVTLVTPAMVGPVLMTMSVHLALVIFTLMQTLPIQMAPFLLTVRIV